MVKPGKFGYLHLVYHFTVPLKWKLSISTSLEPYQSTADSEVLNTILVRRIYLFFSMDQHYNLSGFIREQLIRLVWARFL